MTGIAFTALLTGLVMTFAACTPGGSTPSGDADAAAAFRDHLSGIVVTGGGVVSRILADDSEGSRHQRFILLLESGQTLLVSHNIDLAPRLEQLAPGDTVAFRGTYEWNPQGGLIHMTHDDPEGDGPGGWLRFDGDIYR